MSQSAPANKPTKSQAPDVDPEDGGDLVMLALRDAAQVTSTMESFTGSTLSPCIRGFSFYIPFDGAHAILVVHFEGIPFAELHAIWFKDAPPALVRTQNVLRRGGPKVAELARMASSHQCYGITRNATTASVKALIEGLKGN